jgi:DNA transposase THAP9
MKVRYAVQLFSNSAADGLLYLKKGGYRKFQHCNATVDFIRLFNNLFDIFNSRNLLHRGFKAPISSKNAQHIFEYLNYAVEYIEGLKKTNGKPILQSKCRTGFVGFLLDIESLKFIYITYVTNGPLDYVMVYRLSQDHLEIFFSSIRKRGGFNNNPSSMQFSYAYKRLLVHNEVRSTTESNCLLQDETSILYITPSKEKPKRNFMPILTEEPLLEEDLEILMENELELPNISRYSNDVVAHISGFVMRKVLSKMKCQNCLENILSEDRIDESGLLAIKNRGGLVRPTISLFKLLLKAERTFKSFSLKDLKQKRIDELLIVKTLRFVDRTTFPNVYEYCFNDWQKLTKMCLQAYFLIRLFHEGKLLTASMHGPLIRHSNNKLVLFKGQ